MGWIGWLIPIIGVVVWILANLLQPPEQEQQARKERARLPGEEPGARVRRGKSEVDAFLEEVNRRRREKEVEPRRPAPVEQRREPARRPERQFPDRSEERKFPDRSGERKFPDRSEERPFPVRRGPGEELPTLPLVAEPIIERPARRMEPPQPPAPGPVLEAIILPVAEAPPVQPARTALQKAQVAAVPTQRPATPNRDTILKLLRDANSLRAAFVLQEVLGRPVSQRRQHG